MPSPEYRKDQGSGEPDKEKRLNLYYLAYKFVEDETVRDACSQANELLDNTKDCGLMAFRCHINSLRYVAVVGERLEDNNLEDNLRNIFSQGAPASLSPRVIKRLWGYRELLKLWSIE